MCKLICKCVIKFQIGDVRVKFEYAGLSGESPLGSPAVVSCSVHYRFYKNNIENMVFACNICQPMKKQHL